MKTKNLRNLITNFLIQDFSSRDDNDRMILNVWNTEFHDISTRSLVTVFELLKKKELSGYDSITRLSRKIQEENKELRGDLYEVRHKKAEIIRENIQHLETVL